MLPKAVQQQPVRCTYNSSMPTCQGQVSAAEHYGALPPLKHLPLYLLVYLPKGDPRHSPVYPMLLLGPATYIISGYVAKLQQ